MLVKFCLEFQRRVLSKLNEMLLGNRRVEECDCECSCGRSNEGGDGSELVKIESLEDFSTLEKKLGKKEEFDKLVSFSIHLNI